MARKVFIVDDDPNALRLVSYAFQAEGYEVAIATSGAEALARLASEKPDLVVLDVMMPDMSGLEVCQRIRAKPATARLPILMLSARGLVADRVNGLKAGADDYLPKPADTGELIARAEALLARAAPVAPPRIGRVLAFLGAKGGVGTTTLAVNVAACLAEQGKSVCLLELRPGMGTAGLLLRLRPTHHLGELLDRPGSDVTLRELQGRYLARHSSGLRLLAAPPSADGPCEIKAELAETLATALSAAVDYVVFDLAAAWSAANRAVVRQARYTLVVAQPDALNIECAKATLATLQQWGITGDGVGVVLVNHGGSVVPLPIPTVRAAVSASIVAAIPPAPDVDLIAVKEGALLVTLQPHHVASTAIKDFAGRLMQERIRPL